MKKFIVLIVTTLSISSFIPLITVAENSDTVSSDLTKLEDENSTKTTQETISSETTQETIFSETTQEITSSSNIQETMVSDNTTDEQPQQVNSRISLTDLPGAVEPSKDGLFFIIPFRKGILKQPQSEQYIREGQGFADLAIRTGSAEIGTPDANVKGWKYDPDTGKYSEQKDYGNFKGNGAFIGISTKLNYNIAINNLTEGTYYFQVSINLGIWPLVDTYYSQLAKVIVMPKNVDTNRITINSPNVIFETVDYNASVTPEPYDTTSLFSWNSEFIDPVLANEKLDFYPEIGRSTNLSVTQPSAVLSNHINTNVNTPGHQVNVTVTADNIDAFDVYQTKAIYYGGLAAKEIPPKTNLSWNLDTQGLKDLESVTGEVIRWEYQWQYFEYGSDKAKNFTEGSNFGSAKKVSDFSKPEYALKVANDSTFLEKAAAASNKDQHYSFRVQLKGIIKEKGLLSAEQSSTFYSNRAELRVIPQELRLRKVPSFDFGQISPDAIYEGTTSKGVPSQTPDILEVRDTRNAEDRGWTLNAKLNPFTNNSSQELTSPTTISINSISATNGLNTAIQSTNSMNKILSSDKSEQMYVNGNLILSPTPNVIINNNEMFKSQITWTLTTGQIKSSSL